jgi:hypothetical protein
MLVAAVKHPASAETLYEIKEDSILRVRTVQGALRFIGGLSFEAYGLAGLQEANVTLNAGDLHDMMTLLHTQLQDIQDAEPPLPNLKSIQENNHAPTQ